MTRKWWREEGGRGGWIRKGGTEISGDGCGGKKREKKLFVCKELRDEERKEEMRGTTKEAMRQSYSMR